MTRLELGETESMHGRLGVWFSGTGGSSAPTADARCRSARGSEIGLVVVRESRLAGSAWDPLSDFAEGIRRQ